MLKISVVKKNGFLYLLLRLLVPYLTSSRHSPGHFIRRHLDHLRIRYPPDDNVTDPGTDYNDWSVSSTYTSPTTKDPFNVSPSTSSSQIDLQFVGQTKFANWWIVILQYQLKKGGVL